MSKLPKSEIFILSEKDICTFLDIKGGHTYTVDIDNYYLKKPHIYVRNYKNKHYFRNKNIFIDKRKFDSKIRIDEFMDFFKHTGLILIKENFPQVDFEELGLKTLIIKTPYEIDLDIISYPFDKIMITDIRGLNLKKFSKKFNSLAFNFDESSVIKILELLDNNSAKKITFYNKHPLLRSRVRGIDGCRCDMSESFQLLVNYYDFKNISYKNCEYPKYSGEGIFGQIHSSCPRFKLHWCFEDKVRAMQVDKNESMIKMSSEMDEICLFD